MRSNLDHQTGQTIDVGMMTSHPLVVPVKLPLDNVVPLPQSGHQGLVIGSQELDVLPILMEFLLQTIILEMPPCYQSLNHSSFKGTYPFPLTRQHYPEPHRHRRRVPH